MKTRRAIVILQLSLLCLSRYSLADDELPGGGRATPVEGMTRPAGYQIQLLRSARKGEGSWISMTFDNHGRLILGRDKRGVVRLTLNDQRDSVDRFEVLEDSLKHCRGVLYAHNSLYVCATDSLGFYRLRDLDADDRFEEVKLLKFMDYQSRYGHGTNQVVLGPDDMLYVINGNDVGFPEGVAVNSPYRDPQDDHLLPQARDAVAEVRVGHLLRTDPDGQKWEVIAGGFRNQFDLAFNTDGEMFTYDADMEWDVGLPWYRPTRLNHVISGGEYGWRWGTGKWPTYFADSLPTTLDTGLGSPTGIEFGTRSNFPPRYQQSLYLGDWQNGRILRVELTPKGSSYDCEYDVFLEGGALNVCDLTFGPDGAMYFITGGRGSQSGLYRVTYDGPLMQAEESTEEQIAAIHDAAAARRVRREIEQFHRRRTPDAVDMIWPHLSSDDRWLRFSARLALERQDPNEWRDRALQEVCPTASIAALLALARLGQHSDQRALLVAMDRLPLNELTREQLLDALRVWQLSLIRQGTPSAADRERILTRLNPMYPHTSSYANRELCRLLIALNAPCIVPRTMQVIQDALSQEDAIFHAQLLSHVTDGWTRETRVAFFEWLLTARTYQGGKLLSESLQHIRDDAVATLSDTDREQLKPQLNDLATDANLSPQLPPVQLVKQWAWEDLEAQLPRIGHRRSWQQGQAALAKASCLRCHRFGEQGTFTGPDLTNVGRRFDERALLESILVPSKVIDEKYRSSAHVLKSGRIVTGRTVGVNATTITVEVNPLDSKTVIIQRDEIEESSPSNVSPMPSGLVNVLTSEEILDLIAFLKSGGDQEAEIYRQRTAD